MSQELSLESGKTWVIAIVDDNPDDRAQVRRLLRRGSSRRYDLVEADSGAAAVATILGAPSPFDCVLLDYFMHDMDAPEVLDALVSYDGLPVCPVVVMTGLTSSPDVGRTLLRAGAQDYIGKSWMTPESLTRAIDNASERWSMARELRQREAKLLRSHETFYGLIQNDPFGVFLVDADFRVAQVSMGAERFFHSDHSLLGRDLDEVLQAIWPESFSREMVKRFRHTLANGEPYQTQTVLRRRKDGAEVEAYDWHIERIVLPDDRFGVVCYLYDLTERHRLEAAREESESFFRQTLESIPGMVFTTTAEGSFDYVSEQWVEFTGASATDLLGEGWATVLHPEDRSRALKAWRAAVEGGGTYDLQYRVRRMDGGFEWFKARGRALLDAEGRVARWFGVAINIDNLERARAELSVRERELQSLADNSPDILFRFDRDLRHVFVNAAVERATGRSSAEFLGKTNQEIAMPKDVSALWDKTIREVFTEGRHRSIDFQLETPEGLRCYSARLVPEIGPTGQVDHVLGVTQDVTDRRRAEEELRASDRKKDEFLATLAHELRNPLAPLRNGLEILRRGADTSTGARARDMMERQLGHLVRLVDDLLDVSRISRGKLELQRARVSIQAVIDHALEGSRPLVEAAGHRLSVHAPVEPLWVDGDLVRLAQVVGNLLNNAAKYTPSGGHIELDARAQRDEAVVQVTDDGAGIAAEALPKVFDLFEQVDRTLDRAQGGLGIGLTLAKRLLEMHGGTITGESPGPGLGSTFTVRLPLATPFLMRGVDAQATGEMGAPTGRRVLVVDDNVDAAESLALMLEVFGHEARPAFDGPEALAVARGFRPEVVFLDIGLPGMDGYEVARRFRAEPELAGAVLVALTGWGSAEDKLRSERAGFDHHLTKPADAEDLKRVLASQRRGPDPA